MGDLDICERIETRLTKDGRMAYSDCLALLVRVRRAERERDTYKQQMEQAFAQGGDILDDFTALRRVRDAARSHLRESSCEAPDLRAALHNEHVKALAAVRGEEEKDHD